MSLAPLSAEQEQVVDAVISGRHENPLTKIGGLAGTGKTTVVGHLAERLPGYAVCTLAGKAADVLRQRGIDRAATIHSTIYETKVVRGADGKPILDDRGRPRYQHTLRPYAPAAGFLVDEASMVSVKLAKHLVHYGVPVIAAGDHGQLPPVDESHEEWFASELDYELTENHRQGDELLEEALRIRRGGLPRFEPVTIDDLLDADQVICGTNRTRTWLAAAMRSAQGLPPRPVVGERVVCLHNDYELNVWNGEQLTIREIVDEETLLLETRRGDSIKAPISENSFERDGRPTYFHGDLWVTWAAVITCHKAQGSEWGSVVVIDDTPPKWDRRRWRYTAGTRAQSRIIWTRPTLIDVVRGAA